MHLQSLLDTSFNKYTHRTVLYFLVYDQQKQKDFKKVMSFRGKIIPACQLYKPLPEKHKCRNIPIDFKWEHRRILQIIVDADLFYFHESKTCAIYGPRAEEVECRIRNDLADAYETS